MLAEELRERILEGSLPDAGNRSGDEDYPAEVARLLQELEEDECINVFLTTPEDLQIKTFPFFDHVLQRHILDEMPQPQISVILNNLESNDRVAFFESLDGIEVTEFLNLLNDKNRLATYDLLGYPEESVARLINTKFTTVRKEWTLGQAIDHIRRFYTDTPAANVIFVVDGAGHLVDDLHIRKLVLNDPTSKIEDIMDGFYIKLDIQDKIEDAIQKFKEYDRVAIPVTNSNNVVLGVITIDDVMDEAEEQDTKDMQQFGGVESLDLPYVKTGFFTMIQKRAVWLIILFIGELFTATAMAFFEMELQKAVVLQLFVPLIISSGGNTGSQAATLIIRAMALKELSYKDWWYVMRREILSGLTLGLLLGFIGFVRLAIWQYMGWYNYGEHFNWLLVALTVFMSVVGVVLWGTLTGSMIPMLLKRFRLDPATSSAPFVATLVDVTGLVIYFTIAAVVLGI
jgi:magnesium transporter